MRRRLAAELAALLQRPGPEAAGVGHDDTAPGIHRDERADAQPLLDHRRGATKPALERARLGAVTGPAVAEHERRGARGRFGRRERRLPERPIGRLLAPTLVAAVQEIEEDRR